MGYGCVSGGYDGMISQGVSVRLWITNSHEYQDGPRVESRVMSKSGIQNYIRDCKFVIEFTP